jgi:localization factor PodJL
MSAADERDTPVQAARQRAMIAEIEARLAQFGWLTAQIREGLPEHHAQDLTRIEQGIGSLAQRIGALGRESQRAGERTSPPPSPRAPSSEDDPWDPQSAEALMRVYEGVGVAAAIPDRRARPNSRAWSSREPAAPTKPEPPSDVPGEMPWLEARFAEIVALIERALADANPALALASLDRRLDQFERHLDGALGNLAPAAGRGDLKLIDAHLVEFACQVEALRQQLSRLDTIDAQLRELAHAIESGQQARSGLSALTQNAVAELIDNAAERAASKVAQSLAPLGERRFDTLEALVRDHVAERRRSEEASASVLHSIEDTLVRIVDRVEAMEAVQPAACADSAVRASDGLEADHDRLAEVYAEGARVLGQPALSPTLDAADYVAADRQRQRETWDLAVQPAADAWAAQDEMARTAAVRAKFKAQALAQAPIAPEESAPQSLEPGSLRPRPSGQWSIGPEPPESIGPESIGPESIGPGSIGPESIGHGRDSSWALTKANRYRASLLLGVVMALFFGAGFIAVDSMLAAPPPAATQGQEGVPLPGRPTGNVNVPPTPNAGNPEMVPRPAPRQSPPDAASDDAGEGQSAPTPRLQRLQRGTAAMPASAAPPFMVPPHDGAAGSSAGAASDDAQATRPRLTRPTPDEADGEFELAALFAEGTGVPQTPSQAFAWYERAAARGVAAAQFRLALALERGIGVVTDPERAKVWYGRAAEQGHVRAMHNLGVLLAGGEQADYTAAARWFARAAERGLVDSQFNLAVLHESGRGVPKDLRQAYLWFALAAKSGDAAAIRRLEQVAAQLQPAELAAAEQSIAGWHATATQSANPVAAETSR